MKKLKLLMSKLQRTESLNKFKSKDSDKTITMIIVIADTMIVMEEDITITIANMITVDIMITEVETIIIKKEIIVIIKIDEDNKEIEITKTDKQEIM